jgi:hypothetical protein
MIKVHTNISIIQRRTLKLSLLHGKKVGEIEKVLEHPRLPPLWLQRQKVKY